MIKALKNLFGSVIIFVTLAIFTLGMLCAAVCFPFLIFLKEEKRKTTFVNIMFLPVDLFDKVVLCRMGWLFRD